MKKNAVISMGIANPKTNGARRLNIFFNKFKFNKSLLGRSILDIIIKTAKAVKSKIATILKRNAIPKIRPDINKIFGFNFSLKIKNPENIIRRSMKFSEFAMLPSINGIANINAKMPVLHIEIFASSLLSPKSFFAKK